MSGVNPPRRRGTSTSSFGVGRREGHDATAFYERFPTPVITDDTTVAQPFEIDEPFRLGDSRHLDLPDNSVALVVTSPPYYVGKDYEIDVDDPQVPTSYGEYLQLLAEVFAECVRVIEPGGRIAVNVANLGRKPYRSLSSDIIRILQDELGLLLRGEVIWRKSEGASGNCAWGSFRSASNPVLRDVTERIVIAGKGRFDRAIAVKDRQANQLPFESSVNSDEFMAATLDVWDIPPESAKRVGHPAPFPRELPERLIHLYTFENDLVLDPFMGSGTSLLAAARLGRRYVGYDLDPTYVAVAQTRVAAALADSQPVDAVRPPASTVTGVPDPLILTADPSDDFQARASREGKVAQEIAKAVLERRRLPDRRAKRAGPGAGGHHQPGGARRRSPTLELRRDGRVHHHPGRPAADRLRVEVSGQGLGAGQQRLRVRCRRRPRAGRAVDLAPAPPRLRRRPGHAQGRSRGLLRRHRDVVRRRPGETARLRHR